MTTSTTDSTEATVVLRPGGPADVAVMLRLMDERTAWLVARGRADQWGTEPHSTQPRRIRDMTRFVESGGTWIAVERGLDVPLSITSTTATASSSSAASSSSSTAAAAVTPTRPTNGRDDQNESTHQDSLPERVLGALVVGSASSYVPPATEPELYINFLITDPARGSGRHLGQVLIDKAKSLARERGVSLLRVDCFGGGEGRLVQWYQGRGFVKQEAFETQGWPCQVLSMHL